MRSVKLECTYESFSEFHKNILVKVKKLFTNFTDILQRIFISKWFVSFINKNRKTQYTGDWNYVGTMSLKHLFHSQKMSIVSTIKYYMHNTVGCMNHTNLHIFTTNRSHRSLVSSICWESNEMVHKWSFDFWECLMKKKNSNIK